jgi:hypothetical protein
MQDRIDSIYLKPEKINDDESKKEEDLLEEINEIPEV